MPEAAALLLPGTMSGWSLVMMFGTLFAGMWYMLILVSPSLTLQNGTGNSAAFCICCCTEVDWYFQMGSSDFSNVKFGASGSAIPCLSMCLKSLCI